MDDTRGRGAWARARVWVAATRDVMQRSARLRLWGGGRRGEPTPFGTRLEVFFLDLRHAARSLLHALTYTVVALATLALGIGANTAIFSAIDAVLLCSPEHVVDAEELVTIYTSDFSGPIYGASSYPDFEDFLAGTPALENGSTVSMLPVNIVDGDGVTRTLTAELVAGDYFQMLGASPFLGRWFTGEEGRGTPARACAKLGRAQATRNKMEAQAIAGCNGLRG